MGAFELRSGEVCLGEDILAQLNHVFGFPHLKVYQYAQAHNKFGAVSSDPNNYKNYKDLIDAYEYAGLEVTPRWAAYLKVLGSLVPQGPQNIADIAKFRNDCLTANPAEAMKTIVHTPKDGGHVHTQRGSLTGLPNEVDSPFPLPGATK
jgi:hypothetical protein